MSTQDGRRHPLVVEEEDTGAIIALSDAAAIVSRHEGQNRYREDEKYAMIMDAYQLGYEHGRLEVRGDG